MVAILYLQVTVQGLSLPQLSKVNLVDVTFFCRRYCHLTASEALRLLTRFQSPAFCRAKKLQLRRNILGDYMPMRAQVRSKQITENLFRLFSFSKGRNLYLHHTIWVRGFSLPQCGTSCADPR